MARRDLTYGALSEAMGRDRQWLSRRLRNKQTLSIDDIVEIAEALDVSPQILLVPIVEPVAS